VRPLRSQTGPERRARASEVVQVFRALGPLEPGGSFPHREAAVTVETAWEDVPALQGARVSPRQFRKVLLLER
jgi:hypothetical protein